MWFVPGILVSLVTFPGVIVHEWAHKTAAEACGLHVTDVCYFQLDNPPGYVEHESPRTLGQSFAVTLAPLAVNTLFAGLLLLLGPWVPESPSGVVETAFFVLILAMGMHALPSRGDGKNLWLAAKTHRGLGMFFALPIAGVLYVLDILKIVWIDVFVSIGILLGWVFIWGALLGPV